VRELVVRNVRARVAVAGLGSELASTSLEIPELRLTALGTATNGIELPELIAHVTREIVQSVARKRPELAGALRGELRARIESGVRERIDKFREGLLPPAPQ